MQGTSFVFLVVFDMIVLNSLVRRTVYIAHSYIIFQIFSPERKLLNIVLL